MLIIGSVYFAFAMSRFRRVILGVAAQTQPSANDGEMKRKEYEKELQSYRWSSAIWGLIKAAGPGHSSCLGGQDAAGKGGTIKR